MQERFTPFARADLDARQQAIFDDIASGPRGTVPWIFHLYLNRPERASRVQQLGAFCRYGTSLPPHLSELAILIAGRVQDIGFGQRVGGGCRERRHQLVDRLRLFDGFQ